jgi:hypothetical protein
VLYRLEACTTYICSLMRRLCSSGGVGADAGPVVGRAERAAFAAILVLYLFLSLLVFDQIEEDAFIYFRLVANLANGYGFVFNRGGPPVEAGSSPLWMLLLLLFWKVPVDIVVTAKLLGVAAGCVSLWLVWRIARVHFADPVLRLAAPLLTAGSTPFLMWSQRGLETPLFVLIVLWLALCCTDPRRFRWWPAPAMLLLLARPEGFLYWLGLLPVLACDRDRWRAATPGLLAVAGLAIALLTGRFLYFHDLVPSPFYIKLHAGAAAGVGRIREYVHHSYLFVFASPLVLVGWRPRFWTRQRIVLAVFILIAAVWSVLANDYMPYVRHLVPAIPLIWVLLVGAADALAAAVGRGRRPVVLVYVAVVFVVSLFFSRSSGDFGASGENTVRASLRAFAANPVRFVRATADKLRAPTTAQPVDEIFGATSSLGSNYQSRIGDFLRRNYPADSVVVSDQMGQTPYYAGATMRFVDSWGLTDPTLGRFYFERWKRRDALLRAYDAIASQAVHWAFGERRDAITETTALSYLFGLHPDLILIHTVAIAGDPEGLPASLLRDARLADGYQLRYTLAGAVLLYEKKDAPRKPRLDVPAGLSVAAH